MAVSTGVANTHRNWFWFIILRIHIDFLHFIPGGITTVYVGQPLDTVKVKMQTFPTLYTGGFNCFMETFKQDGIARGLYAGTVPSLAANISENAVLFLFYGLCQKVVSRMFSLYIKIGHMADLPFIQILSESFRFFCWNLVKFRWLDSKLRFFPLKLVEISI